VVLHIALPDIAHGNSYSVFACFEGARLGAKPESGRREGKTEMCVQCTPNAARVPESGQVLSSESCKDREKGESQGTRQPNEHERLDHI
jgi:hypothetical protein